MPETRLTDAQLYAWSEGISSLVLDAGSSSASIRLGAALQALVAYDYSSFFILRRRSAPIAIHDEVPTDTEPVDYVTSPYLLDPVYIHFLRGTLPRYCSLEELAPDGFSESDYFLTYWKDIKLGSEFDFNVPYDEDTVLHLVCTRSKGSSSFSKVDKSRFAAVYPVVAAVLQRFWDARHGDYEGGGEHADSFHERLGFVLENFGCSMLTNREMEIVQLTMRGFSDKLAARELHITPGTVRNHKKSIYNKLQVSSQGQIFGLLLDVLELPADEDLGPDPLVTLLERRGGHLHES